MFTTGGILINVLLANVPQALLSFSYFSLNRLCTSICFAQEWNEHGRTRKALRTSNPEGQQRANRYLHLPYHWEIPLTAVSGLMHWLLSQSLFLVRLEIRDQGNELKPSESKCTCGYSPLSILVFSVTHLLTLVIVVCLYMRKMTVKIPPADHCSLVISAACHPPPDDPDAYQKPVRWGVVKSQHSGTVQHCSFTSQPVSRPVSGVVYN